MANKTIPLIRRKGRDIVERAETAASYTDGSHDLRITVDNGAFIGTQSSTNLVLKTNNTNRLSIHTDGSIKLHNYGSGSNTGTSAYHLAVDSSGNIIEAAAVNGTSGTSGSSGNNGNNGANGTSGTSGSSGNNGNNGANGTSGTSGLLSLSGTTNNGIITLNGSAPNATVESNVVINGGSLGIGTASPSQPLHVNGNGLATRFVSNYFGIYDGAAFDCYMYVNDANPTYGSYSYGGTFEFVSDQSKPASLLDAGGVRIQRNAIINDHWEVYHDTTSDDLVFNFIG